MVVSRGHLPRGVHRIRRWPSTSSSSEFFLWPSTSSSSEFFLWPSTSSSVFRGWLLARWPSTSSSVFLAPRRWPSTSSSVLRPRNFLWPSTSESSLASPAFCSPPNRQLIFLPMVLMTSAIYLAVVIRRLATVASEDEANDHTADSRAVMWRTAYLRPSNPSSVISP